MKSSFAQTHPLSVVCVESSWCDLAKQIGGSDVQVNILISPGIDPHDLSPTPNMARQLAQADIVILNGATYDDWALSFVPKSGTSINVAHETGWKFGENPHLFLNLKAVQKTTNVITSIFEKYNLPNEDINRRANIIIKEINKFSEDILEIKKIYSGGKIATIEPIANSIFIDMGLNIVDNRFSLAIMNHSEPSPQDVAQLELSINNKEIKFLALNPSIHSPQIDRIVNIANKNHIKLVSIGESLPMDTRWQNWVQILIQSVQKALDAKQ